MANDVGELANETLAEQQREDSQLANTARKEAPKYNNPENNNKKKGFFRKMFDLVYLTTISAAATILSVATTGPLGVLIGGGFAGGGLIGTLVKKTKPLYEAVTDFLKTYFSVNLVIQPVVWLGNVTYPVVGALGSKIAGGIGAAVTKTAYAVTAYNGAFVGLFKGAHHLAEHYLNPIGITKSIREDYFPLTKRINMGMSPALALTANGVHSIMGISPFAINALPVGYYHATHPSYKKK